MNYSENNDIKLSDSNTSRKSGIDKKSKSNELDFIKILDQIIEQYNKTEAGHYLLRLTKALKRGWY